MSNIVRKMERVGLLKQRKEAKKAAKKLKRNVVNEIVRVQQFIDEKKAKNPFFFGATVSAAAMATPFLAGGMTGFPNLPDLPDLLPGLGGATFAFAAMTPKSVKNGKAVGATPTAGPEKYLITAEVRQRVRDWHGTPKQQVENLRNLVTTFIAKATDWGVPTDMLSYLQEYFQLLDDVMTLCDSLDASARSRNTRNRYLNDLVPYALGVVRGWCIGKCALRVIDIAELNDLGFLMPGQTAGHKARSKGTEILACVKVRVIGMDNFTIIIEQSEGKDGVPMHRAWPEGVRQALIIILEADGKTEVYRTMTTKLHTDITLEAKYRGKALIAKAAFLKHIDDTPKFGNEPAFSTPLNTEDLANAVELQKHLDVEEHQQQMADLHAHTDAHIESLQDQIAELKAQLAAKK